MPLDVSAAILSKLTAQNTRPIFVVKLNHSGTTEYISCAGDVTFDSQVYTPGATIRSLAMGRSANIDLAPTSTRMSEVQSGTWRGGICQIYMLPALPTDTPTFTTADAILALDGLIDTSYIRASALTITARNKYLTGTMTPSLTINQIANHIPAAGAITEWEGEIVTTEPYDYGVVGFGSGPR